MPWQRWESWREEEVLILSILFVESVFVHKPSKAKAKDTRHNHYSNSKTIQRSYYVHMVQYYGLGIKLISSEFYIRTTRSPHPEPEIDPSLRFVPGKAY